MFCLVTAGPTGEPIDQVRRLTNTSTGTLGTGLAGFLAARGHTVILLRSESASCTSIPNGCQVQPFATTADLAQCLVTRAGTTVNAVFHVAAVSDFSVHRVWRETADGQREVVRDGKLDSRGGRLLLELQSTPKLIARLRDWFPKALLVGWKFEVDGDIHGAIAKAQRQIELCRTDACVANGPAYGDGYGLVSPDSGHRPFKDAPALFVALANLMEQPAPGFPQEIG